MGPAVHLGIKLYIVGWEKALPCDPACLQMARRVSPPFLHRRVGFASPSLPTDLMCMLHIFPSGARCPFSVS